MRLGLSVEPFANLGQVGDVLDSPGAESDIQVLRTIPEAIAAVTASD